MANTVYRDCTFVRELIEYGPDGHAVRQVEARRGQIHFDALLPRDKTDGYTKYGSWTLATIDDTGAKL